MSISRRSLLRGLLTLPLAPLAAKLLPEPDAWVLEGMDGITEPAKPHFVGIDEAMGSDQTSIWIGPEWGWGESPGQRALEDSKFLRAMAEDLESKLREAGKALVEELSVQEKIRRAVRNSL